MSTPGPEVDGHGDWEPEEWEDWGDVRYRMIHSDSGGSARSIWQACMVGDLERVKYLVEVEEVNVNQKDSYDALPIYFCCLCGHDDVLEYLLDHGARLDDGTFEAHRCYYAALTDKIKRVLREAKAKPNLGCMDHFAEQLRKNLCPTSFSRGEGGGFAEQLRQAAENHADFRFLMPAGSDRAPVPAHRCVLAARCKYFDKLFSGQWQGRRHALLPRCAGIRGEAFDVLLEYIYTDSVNFELTLADELLDLAKQCGLSRLQTELERELHLVCMHLRQLQGSVSHITRVNLKPGGNTLVGDDSLRSSLRCLLPSYDDAVAAAADGCRQPAPPQYAGKEVARLKSLGSRYSDVRFACRGNSGGELSPKPPAVIFESHRCILAARSEYFRTMLGGPWGLQSQSRQQQLPPPIDIAMQPWLFHAVLEWAYTDALPSVLPSATALAELRQSCCQKQAATALPPGGEEDREKLCEAVEVCAAVLDAATMLLCVELRQLAVAHLVHSISPSTAPRLAVLGSLFSSVRLLDAATDYIVDNLLLFAASRYRSSSGTTAAAANDRDSATQSTSNRVAEIAGLAGELLEPTFATFLDQPSNWEVALHLTRELIERYTADDFEDVLGRGVAGPKRAPAGQAHSAELLPELRDDPVTSGDSRGGSGGTSGGGVGGAGLGAAAAARAAGVRLSAVVGTVVEEELLAELDAETP